ncbi:MAG: peptide deformylase [Patescibacteria group bacterium]|nr:peptide deformylase [Patescibacteria group bacterium]
MKESIVQAGNPVLRTKARPVAKKDIGSAKVKNLVKKMRAALSPEENGVAIAAPQVGEPLQIFIVAGRVFAEEPEDSADVNAGRTRKRQGEQEQNLPAPRHDMVFINPEIIRSSRKKKIMSEGCLSVRGVFGTVMRHEKTSVRALDERGEPFTYHGSGLLAQIFQHETDHLNGILFIDKAEKIDEPKK